MTVLDTSCVVDLLVEGRVAPEVSALLDEEMEAAAPDLLVFEALAVLRRHALRGELSPERAAGAVVDLGDVPLALFPSLPLRARAWSLKEAMTAADAIFVALAEELEEPLATKDAALARAAQASADVQVVTF